MEDLHSIQIGQGRVLREGKRFTLSIPPADASAYHDAQITSYRTRADFGWTPPLRLYLRARFEGEVQGTAGFGFWNHPLLPGKRGWPALQLPRALWFFYGSPPNNMTLARDIPGHGWKAATFNAARWPFLALLPAAPLGFLLMRIPALYRRLWPVGQWAIGVSEAALAAALMPAWHDYSIDWRHDGVTFLVDGEVVHYTDRVPPGPLGFIVWIDNQYAIVTPQGRFGYGLLDVAAGQSLHIESLRIETHSGTR